MAKKIGTLLLSLITACLFVCPMHVSAQPPEVGDWDRSNTVTILIMPELHYIYEILADVSGAFAYLDLKDAYIANKSIYPNKHLELLLVLNEGGDAQQDAAVAALSADPRVRNAQKSCDVPYEAINTLEIIASANTVKVGETLTVKPDGMLDVFHQFYSYDKVGVKFNKYRPDYDPQKEYTLADFPHFDFASIKKIEQEENDFTHPNYILTLTQPGYFNMRKAINALALDPNIDGVYITGGVGFPSWDLSPDWIISDTSIADFTDKEICGFGEDGATYYECVPNEQGEVVIKGLKPGKVTVTYVPSFGWKLGNEYAVTCEITVTEADAPIIKESPKKEAPKKEDPATGDSDIMLLCTIGVLTVISFAALLVVRKKTSR